MNYTTKYSIWRKWVYDLIGMYELLEILVKCITECCESHLGLVHAMKRKKGYVAVPGRNQILAYFDCI